MNIQEALKETGKARRESWVDTDYITEINNELNITSAVNGLKPLRMGFSIYDLSQTDWVVYHPQKEIVPTEAGELWIKDEKTFAWFVKYKSLQGNDGLEMIARNNVKKEIKSDMIHGRGWTRIHPPVEGEKIVIEGVSWRKDHNSTLIYPGADTEVVWSELIDKGRMTMTLTWDKEKP